MAEEFRVVSDDVILCHIQMIVSFNQDADLLGYTFWLDAHDLTDRLAMLNAIPGQSLVCGIHKWIDWHCNVDCALTITRGQVDRCNPSKRLDQLAHTCSQSLTHSVVSSVSSVA